MSTKMWNVQDVYAEKGWAGVLKQFYREVKVFHLELLQHRLQEAASASAHAPLTRKRPVVQARLVATSDAGEDVPLASLTDDLRRKQALRPVMGPQESDNYQRDDGSWTGGDPTLEGQEPKESVNYRLATDDHKRCDRCVHWMAPSGCERVAGLIRRVDVCDLFTPSKAQEAIAVFRAGMKKYPDLPRKR